MTKSELKSMPATPVSGDKYFYLWVVALISFGIGILTGFGIGFKRFVPELVEQYLLTNYPGPTQNAIPEIPTPEPMAEDISSNLPQALAWLAAENLNEYGDALGTVYAGGTPLFNENTSESLDHYEFLKDKFGGEPWL